MTKFVILLHMKLRKSQLCLLKNGGDGVGDGGKRPFVSRPDVVNFHDGH